MPAHFSEWIVWQLAAQVLNGVGLREIADHVLASWRAAV